MIIANLITKDLPIKFISQNSKIFHKYKSLFLMIIECQLWCDDDLSYIYRTFVLF